MKRLHRLDLSPHAQRVLANRTQAVEEAPDPKAKAAQLWDRNGRARKTFGEVRETLERMASGIERCMYCEDSRGTHIEHFWPKDRFPQKAFVWENYLLACSGCNSNYKRNRFPLDDESRPLLIDPTVDEPRDHLLFSPTTGRFKELDEKGKMSREVFDLNGRKLDVERRNAWLAFQSLLGTFARAKHAGNEPLAAEYKQVIQGHQFASVFVALLDLSQQNLDPNPLLPECRRALKQFPEIYGWA